MYIGNKSILFYLFSNTNNSSSYLSSLIPNLWQFPYDSILVVFIFCYYHISRFCKINIHFWYLFNLPKPTQWLLQSFQKPSQNWFPFLEKPTYGWCFNLIPNRCILSNPLFKIFKSNTQTCCVQNILGKGAYIYIYSWYGTTQ